jgi:hypothetical protein
VTPGTFGIWLTLPICNDFTNLSIFSSDTRLSDNRLEVCVCLEISVYFYIWWSKLMCKISDWNSISKFVFKVTRPVKTQ